MRKSHTCEALPNPSMAVKILRTLLSFLRCLEDNKMISRKEKNKTNVKRIVWRITIKGRKKKGFKIVINH